MYLHLGSPLSDSPLQQPQASFPMHHGGVPYNSLRPLSLCTMEVCRTTASGLFPYAPWRCALQQPQASFPMHHGGVPYILRLPYESWRCALQHPQASLCIRKVCLTTSSGLPMHQEGVPYNSLRLPVHQEGVPYNILRPPYASWRCALKQPQASLCLMEVCLTTASGLPEEILLCCLQCQSQDPYDQNIMTVSTIST